MSGAAGPQAAAREGGLGCDPARDEPKPYVQFGAFEEVAVALLPRAVLKVALQPGERCFDRRGGQLIPR